GVLVVLGAAGLSGHGMRPTLRGLTPLRRATLAQPPRRGEITVAGIGIVLVVGESLPGPGKVLDVVDRDGGADVFAERGLHVRDADDLALEVEERAARVTWIDRRVGLEVDQALKVPVQRAQDALRHASLQAKRIAHSEDTVARAQVVQATQDDVRGFQ